MSFSGDTKGELCRQEIAHRSRTQAAAYGALLYCNTFQSTGVRIVTECADFARRLPPLFRRAFRVDFDSVTEGERGGKRILSITDPYKLGLILDTFGIDPGAWWPTTSTSPCWRRSAAGRPFCGGLFWREGR